MNTLDTILIYGIPCSLILSAVVMFMLWYNPRLFLQDFPKDIQAAVPPKTKAEKRVSAYWATAIILLLIAFPLAAALSSKAAHHSLFEIFLSAFGVAFLFNTVDWLILDWLIVCTLTPKFMVIPGTEGMAGYKNYMMHFRGFLIGTVFSGILGLLLTIIVVFI